VATRASRRAPGDHGSTAGTPGGAAGTRARLVEDLGLDSLDAVELAISVERKFDIGGWSELQELYRSRGEDMVALARVE
jgi:hypothetical protein